ncbi:MAG: UDP-N-acetylmuramoyl-L-alanine--D-glutamate ligase [bacterium]
MVNETLLQELSTSTVGIYGYGNTGRCLAEELSGRVGEIIVYDDCRPSEIKSGPLQESIQWVFSPKALQEDLDYLFVSPGIPGDHPILRQAREFNIPVWGDLELSYRLLGNESIWAVTGTNGKSTCTELLGCLLGEVFDQSSVAVCGNRGQPLISKVFDANQIQHYVVEVSSFQVENMETFSPDVGLLTNLGEDHMDYHRSIREYHGLKLELLRRVRTDGTVVVPESEADRSPSEGVERRTVDENAMAAGPVAWDPETGLTFGDSEIAPSEIPLPLREFPENLLLAVTALRDRLTADRIRRALDVFEPLPYRGEPVDTSNGKLVINDSKGTNPSAVIEQLNRREGPVHLVLGGEAKEVDYGRLIGAVRDSDVRSLTLAGEGSTTGELSDLLESESVSYTWVTDWETAVKQAYDRTRDGETLLLSPGGTSFDAFENYKDRGEQFDRWIREADQS